jgi:hypothetical protein
MRPESAPNLRSAFLKAMSFPALMGLLIFVAIVLGKHDYDLESIAPDLVFSCVMVAIISVPFLFFGWLRWSAANSSLGVREFEQRVKPVNFGKRERR